MTHTFRLFFLLTGALLSGCGADAPSNTSKASKPVASSHPGLAPSVKQVNDADVLAYVGAQVVTKSEFLLAAQRRSPVDGVALSESEKKEVLDSIVVDRMLYAQAMKNGISDDPKVQKVMVNVLLRKEVYGTVRNSDFSSESLKAYFEEHKSDFEVPEKVQIKRIFIRVSDRHPDAKAKTLAMKLRERVTADVSMFGAVAKESSEDAYKRRGGDVGFVSAQGKPGVDIRVVEKAFTMKVGEVSEVFEAGGGYNILLVANKREKSERSYEQMKGSVIRKMKNAKYEDLYKNYVDGIRDFYTVKVNDESLGSIQVSPSRRGPAGLVRSPAH